MDRSTLEKVGIVGAATVIVALLCWIALGSAGGAGQEPPPGYVAPTPTSACEPGTPKLRVAAKALESAPETFRTAILGDSTRDEKAAGLPFVRQLRTNLEPGTVKSFGMNGISVARYAEDPIQGKIRRFNPDLIELSIGINDLRESESTAEEFTENLRTYVAGLHRDLPDATILLSVPAALADYDVDGAGYVAEGTAQQVTDDLREAYLTVAKRERYVAMFNTQAAVTGTKVDTRRPPKFLVDQIHPNPRTAVEIADLITADLTTCAT